MHVLKNINLSASAALSQMRVLVEAYIPMECTQGQAFTLMHHEDILHAGADILISQSRCGTATAHTHGCRMARWQQS